MNFDFFTPYDQLIKTKSKKGVSINKNSKDIKLLISYLEGKKTLSDLDVFISKMKDKKLRFCHALKYFSVAIQKIEEIVSEVKDEMDANETSIKILKEKYDLINNLRDGTLSKKSNEIIDYLKFNFFDYKLPAITIDKDSDIYFTDEFFRTNSLQKLNDELSNKYIAFAEYYCDTTFLKLVNVNSDDIILYLKKHKHEARTIEKLTKWLVQTFLDDYENKLMLDVDNFKDGDFVLTNVYVKRLLRMTDNEKLFMNELLDFFIECRKSNFNYLKILLFLRWFETSFLEVLINIKQNKKCKNQLYFILDNIFNQTLHLLAYVYFNDYKRNKLN